MIGAQGTQTLCYVIFREPANFPRSRFRDQRFQPFRSDKLNGSRAVLTYMGNQPEDISHRRVEFEFIQFRAPEKPSAVAPAEEEQPCDVQLSPAVEYRSGGR